MPAAGRMIAIQAGGKCNLESVEEKIKFQGADVVHCGNDAVNLDHWIFEQHSSKGSARPFGVVSFRGLEKAASQAHSRKPKVLEADCNESKS